MANQQLKHLPKIIFNQMNMHLLNISKRTYAELKRSFTDRFGFQSHKL